MIQFSLKLLDMKVPSQLPVDQVQVDLLPLFWNSLVQTEIPGE